MKSRGFAIFPSPKDEQNSKYGKWNVANQYICARYLGAETPAILGSVAAILAIVVYARLFAGGHEPAAVLASEELGNKVV